MAWERVLAEARGRGDFLKEVHAEAQRGRILVRARRMILRLEKMSVIRSKKYAPNIRTGNYNLRSC